MRIAIDVMGGDHAPDAILEGALNAVSLLGPQDRIYLVGDRQVIEEGIAERGLRGDGRLVVEPTTEVVGMGDSPVDAIRNKPNSSLARTIWLGSSRAPDPVDVVLSAGNTGACVSAAQMSMRRLPGVHRPGIAVTIPTFAGPVVICDVGANIVPKPHHLHQYGHMAGVYATLAHGIQNPRVAVLSVGGEEGKGTSLTKDTAKLMRADPYLNYVGYIEGRDIFDNHADVVVTEGFTGNVVLKLAEGLASGLFRTIAHEIFEIDPELAMRFEPVVKAIYKKHDYHEYGGAPLLGARGICLITHGSAQARTITAGVRASLQYSRMNLNQAIVERLAKATPTRDAEVEA